MYWVAPTVGQAPTRAPVWPKIESSAAITKSHHSISSCPPPTQAPSTMAITGMGRLRQVMATFCIRSFHMYELALLSFIMAWKSPPAEKWPPTPYTTAATMVGSSRVELSASASSSRVCSRNALRTSGRLMPIQAASLRTSKTISWYGMVLRTSRCSEVGRDIYYI